jgi:transposase
MNISEPASDIPCGCNPRNRNLEKAQGLSPELQAALEPLLAAIETLSERIREYNQQIEKIAGEAFSRDASVIGRTL